MKKMLIAALALIMLITFAACAGQGGIKETASDTPVPDGTTADTPVDGGWGEAQSIVITDEVKAMFDKLNETMTGAYYEPIVYLSSQVVVGTNHKVLCKMIPSVSNIDALGSYVIVTVYEDLDKKAEITEVLYSGVAAPQPNNPDHPVTGGWSEPETYAVTDEAKQAVKKASSDPYEPVALLGSQVVAGMNYLVLCKPNPQKSGQSEYEILTVYADLQGNAETTDIASFSQEADAGNDTMNGSDDSDSTGKSYPAWIGTWKSSTGEYLQINSVTESGISLVFHKIVESGKIMDVDYHMEFDNEEKTIASEIGGREDHGGWEYVFELHDEYITVKSRYPDQLYYKDE